ncbi:MAG: hydrogenase 3 maturation endopeptidase HyCI [Candidatus Aenigmarchaeota archaeon]|nr:hydrogenase 3 maturation endopeptidase HyCI [Candidatus Aenigmarchaeota archaeon]
MSKFVVVGMGNKLRADDGFGSEVVRKLRGNFEKNVLLINAGDVPENFLEKIVNFNPDKIFIIDTMKFKGKIGEIKIFDPDEVDLKSFSTHKSSLFIDYLKKRLGCEIELIGIKPKTTEFGKRMSAKIKKRIDDVAKIIKDRIFH